MIVEPAEWKRRVCSGGCVVHNGSVGECTGRLEAHHVVTQQHIRKRGLDDALRWNVHNGIGVCERAHARHTRAIERIPRDCLPQSTIKLIETTPGLKGYLDRYYPVLVIDDAAGEAFNV